MPEILEFRVGNKPFDSDCGGFRVEETEKRKRTKPYQDELRKNIKVLVIQNE